MRRALTVVLVILVLTGCTRYGEFPLCYVDLGEPSAPVTRDSINEDEDVIQHGYKLLNVEKLDEFFMRKSGYLRVVRYTVEGDPIFHDLWYEDGRVLVRVDNTLDGFGVPLIETYSCSSLHKEETNSWIHYALSRCSGEQERVEVFGYPNDLEHQS